MATDSGIVSANLDLLRQGADLIRRLPDVGYGEEAGTAAAVGPHFRHVLEHYSCFLAGRAAGRVNYDARERDPALERDRCVALARIEELAGELRRLAGADLAAPAEVRLECGSGGEPEQWSRSTIGRELQFLLSHTVHHFALIALLLARRGIETGPDFGVAPSTLEHRRAQAACAPHPG
jgi:hypothetical protein